MTNGAHVCHASTWTKTNLYLTSIADAIIITPQAEKLPKKQDESTNRRSSSPKLDLEYVKLNKISQSQFEDTSDEPSSAGKHHSGHFRHSMAPNWDLHPQYEFTAFGKRFHLILTLDINFVSPNVKITHISEDSIRREHPGNQLGCFYSGTVHGDPQSSVAVSLCHGMTGHVRTSTGSYIIKPAEPWQESDKDPLEFSLRHAIQRIRPVAMEDRSNDNDQAKRQNCGVIDDKTPTPISSNEIYTDSRHRERRSLTEKKAPDEDYEQYMKQNEKRQQFVRNDNRYDRYFFVERRQNEPSEEYNQDSEMELDPSVALRSGRASRGEYFIEIMVAADAEMVRYHGKNLFSYIMVLMSTVSQLYKDKSIGNCINISVVNIVSTNKTFGTRYNETDGIAASDMLREFRKWQNEHNPNETSPLHHDAALLLTRENLCDHSKEIHCDTLGLAELGRMCFPGSSCAIVRDSGLAAAFTMAHEIGHVLDMPHDNDTKCKKFRKQSDIHNIMSMMLDDHTFPWTWSKCSQHYVTKFLEGGNGDCLLDEPSKIMERPDNTRLPGEDYSENSQCELVYGHGSRICYPGSMNRDDVCRILYCTTPEGDPVRGKRGSCRTQYMPWADGTECDVDKWCYRGECVPREILKPVDGQWGAWGRFSECSRTCGGGVKKKVRLCNNPPPENGGKCCIGDSVKYRSCGTRECPGNPDFREEQCSAFDNNTLGIENLMENVTWHAKYREILPQERCKLVCQVNSTYYHMLKDKVKDGTPCGRDTSHMCVNGRCTPAGCDHVLNSNAKIDICGVCKGDNSTCQWIRGSYNSSNQGYTRVTKIPAGSRNIDIRQYSWMGIHNDNNYLALRLGENGEHIVNGKHMVMHQRVIETNGTIIEYSGSETAVERLNISKVTEIDLTLEVLSSPNRYPPQITYEYTVPKEILSRYSWILSNWTECSPMCQGMKYRKAECRNIGYEKDVVSNDYCRESEKPREARQMCGKHCILEWEVTVSECSNHCGPGIRKVSSRCVQKFLNSNEPPRPTGTPTCAHLVQPSDEEPCMGPCKNVHWSYGKWSACNVTCGGGVQHRTAKCVDWNGREVPEGNCAGQEKHLTVVCGQQSCPKWELDKWSSCSVTCGMGTRSRKFLCHIDNRLVQSSYCGKLPQPIVQNCNAARPCEQWHTGDWSSCSVTCGEGTKVRKVICKSVDGMKNNKCSSSSKPENITACIVKPCPTIRNIPSIKYFNTSNLPYEIFSQQANEVLDITFHPGYKWHSEIRRECSRPCIRSFMHVNVKCISIEKGTIVPESYCDTKEKPPTAIRCSRDLCPMWKTDNWSECDAECDSGLQRRNVYCQSPRGEILSDEECHDREKPKIVKICRKSPCMNSPTDRKNRLETNILRKWKFSQWSPCSKSCGSGLQWRRVECTMRRGNHGPEVTVKDEQCSRLGLRRPRSQRPCRRVACDYIWQEEPWSECSAECGEGIQSRIVSCHQTNARGFTDLTPTNNCPMDQKPATSRPCKVRECNDQYYWRAGPWKQCSHDCGQKGRQMRKLFCYDRNDRQVPRVYCPRKFKPRRKQKCNQIKCYPMSCLDAKKYYNTNKDNEYTLVVAGRSMLIYCYEMSSSYPKEYLTLRAGYRENYAEVNNKRLNYAENCPYNVRRHNCDCQIKSGKTEFRRVRIDPVKLYILENDYTFSWTNGTKRIEYGTAGDCYNSVHCPQGRFSINLSGTQFRISPEVVWKGTHEASVEINNINSQRVVGKCGGTCGICKPAAGLKLDVLPP
ncbi:A disintegrin and metalloproteinase with thrombospondin motifs 9 [Habropoda laboriosa]|uniref:A disintegrin and metalloproteinase with thrombospondin motifs 9 n=1 Tax=Habropoda laboriosa TaxID=597456 RepID=A0A0L7R1B9_9HYME|nr:A disintegrin and metalloproteinase with thrombospondin motifs 9 [Habropoda laboriosa]